MRNLHRARGVSAEDTKEPPAKPNRRMRRAQWSRIPRKVKEALVQAAKERDPVMVADESHKLDRDRIPDTERSK